MRRPSGTDAFFFSSRRVYYRSIASTLPTTSSRPRPVASLFARGCVPRTLRTTARGEPSAVPSRGSRAPSRAPPTTRFRVRASPSAHDELDDPRLDARHGGESLPPQLRRPRTPLPRLPVGARARRQRRRRPDPESERRSRSSILLLLLLLLLLLARRTRARRGPTRGRVDERRGNLRARLATTSRARRRRIDGRIPRRRRRVNSPRRTFWRRTRE